MRYRWTGREYDAETGWYFHRARYYDPAERRFVQEDPIGYGGGGNLYAYVSGQVLEARDPSGTYMEYAVEAGPGGGQVFGFGAEGGGWGNDFRSVDDGYLDNLMDGLQTLSQCSGGVCAGGLTEKQVRAVITSLSHMNAEWRGKVTSYLSRGQIRSYRDEHEWVHGKIKAEEEDIGERNVYINSNFSYESYHGDFFLFDSRNLAKTLIHEMRHIWQLELTPSSEARAFIAKWTDKLLDRWANDYACQQLVPQCHISH